MDEPLSYDVVADNLDLALCFRDGVPLAGGEVHCFNGELFLVASDGRRLGLAPCDPALQDRLLRLSKVLCVLMPSRATFELPVRVRG